MRNYKFRLYPTALQEQQFEQTLDGCRWLYNYFLKLMPMSEYDMNYTLVELKEQKLWLRNYHSKMLQMVASKIAAARKALAALQRNGHKIGKLRYLTAEEYNSFTYHQSGFKLVGSKLWLSKIGSIHIKLHRHPFNIKQVTVFRQNGKWYAIMACELKSIFKFIDPYKSIGIDVGITKFSHDSDDHIVENPLFLNKMIRPIKIAHKRLSRRHKGGSNYKKAKHMLARLYERIHNKRKDFLHKLSNQYSKSYDVIFLERLCTFNMVKNHRLAKHILDSGWRTFKAMLEYKTKMILEEVEPQNTSVNCSRCGNAVPKSLAVRTHSCNKCGLVIDRDYNASRNILYKGLRKLPVERREVTPVEIPSESLKQELKGAIVQADSSCSL
ncbi:MAG: RNA-guided endonuclease TnpB family protein [Thermoproteota archaeon]